MKYILNEIPVKTTNGFNINNLKIDLEIPTNLEYKKFICENIEDIEIKYSEINNFKSNIGLDLPKALNLDININKSINKVITFIYEFNDENLVDNININCSDNVNANILFKYISKTDSVHFHHLKQNINLGKNSNINITVLNLLNNNSLSFIASESTIDSHSVLNQTLIDIGGKVKVNNYKSDVKEFGNSYLNNVYLGKNEDIIDMNYYFKNIGINSLTNIESQGVLNGHSKKTFRSTIDFISGCSKSIGKESENCILLSDTCISKSVPLLLCGEEDVEGAHSVSSGKLEDNKLFYIMSRSLSEEEAKRMIIMSNFNKIISSIKDKKLEEEIKNLIEMSI